MEGREEGRIRVTVDSDLLEIGWLENQLDKEKFGFYPKCDGTFFLSFSKTLKFSK